MGVVRVKGEVLRLRRLGVISAEVNACNDCSQLQRLLNSTLNALAKLGTFEGRYLPTYQPRTEFGLQLAFCSSHYVSTSPTAQRDKIHIFCPGAKALFQRQREKRRKTGDPLSR